MHLHLVVRVFIEFRKIPCPALSTRLSVTGILTSAGRPGSAAGRGSGTGCGSSGYVPRVRRGTLFFIVIRLQRVGVFFFSHVPVFVLIRVRVENQFCLPFRFAQSRIFIFVILFDQAFCMTLVPCRTTQH